MKGENKAVGKKWEGGKTEGRNWGRYATKSLD